MAFVAATSDDAASVELGTSSIRNTAVQQRGSSSSRVRPGRVSATIDRAILGDGQRLRKLTYTDLSVVSGGGSAVRMIHPRRATESPETGRRVEAMQRRARRREYDRGRRRTENDSIHPIEEESSLVGSDCDTCGIVDQNDRSSMLNQIGDLNLFDELMSLHGQTVDASQKKSSPFRIVRDEKGHYRLSRKVSRRRNSEWLPRPKAEEEQERRQSLPSDNVTLRKKFQPLHRRASFNEKIQGIVKPSKYLSRESSMTDDEEPPQSHPTDKQKRIKSYIIDDPWMPPVPSTVSSSTTLKDDEISHRTAKAETLDISTRSEGWIPCGVEFSETAEIFVIDGIDGASGSLRIRLMACVPNCGVTHKWPMDRCRTWT